MALPLDAAEEGLMRSILRLYPEKDVASVYVSRLFASLDAERAKVAALERERDAAFARGRIEGIEEAAKAAGSSAWKHEGDDAYSRGMDRGAVQQVRACVEAIRALLPSPAAPEKETMAEAEQQLRPRRPTGEARR